MTKRLAVVAVVALALFALSALWYAKPVKSAGPVQYKVVMVLRPTLNLEKELNKTAGEGWTLVNVVHVGDRNWDEKVFAVFQK